MGVAAAFVMPVTLSVITTIFPPEERGKAVGTWVGVAAGGAVIGLLVSGVLLEWLSWPADLRPQRRARDARARGHDRDRPADPRVAPAAARPDRDAALGRRARGARLRDHRGRRARLGRLLRRRGTRRRRRRARRLRRAGSSAAATRCSTRATSCAAASAPGSLSVTVQFFAAFGFLFLALPYLQLVMGFSPLQRVGRAAADGARRDPALARRAGDRRPRRRARHGRDRARA